MHDNALKLAKQSLAIWDGRSTMSRNAAQLPGGCWDLLFLLYVAEQEGTVVSRRSAAVRCSVSDAIFARWITILAMERLVTAEPSPEGRVALTTDARDRLARLLEVATRE